jgi:hypothetical protein
MKLYIPLKMGRSITCKGNEICYKSLVRNAHMKRSKSRWEDGFKVDFRDTDYEGVD